MSQLASVQRGDLNASPPTGVTNKQFAQAWTLDPTGNWSELDQDDDGNGTWNLEQARAHNQVNEIDGHSGDPIYLQQGGSGTNWADPAHDAAGNMTSVPKPSSLANGLTLKWDAWNRLVELKDGQTVVGKYESDGLNRRVKKHIDSQSPGSPNGIDRYEHLYYTASWQVLEMRDTTTESAEPEGLQPDYQYVWSAGAPRCPRPRSHPCRS